MAVTLANTSGGDMISMHLSWGVLFFSCKRFFLTDAGDFDMMLFLMTIPLIRKTNVKPKNNSLLDLYYPWIIDRFSLILSDTFEYIKNKSCV